MRWTPEEFAEQIGAFRREVAGIVRKMTIGAVSGASWQMIGHRLIDYGDLETSEVEVFSGIGFFSRPAGGGTAEAIMVEIGGANGPAVIATRDEATRALVDDIAADETTLYNSLSRVQAKADGTIEARSHAGAASALAFEADFAAIVHILSTWVVVANDGGAALKAAINAYIGTKPGGWPFGTSKLKAE